MENGERLEFVRWIFILATGSCKANWKTIDLTIVEHYKKFLVFMFVVKNITVLSC